MLTWFLVCHQGSLVGLCTQDYKSLCGALTICATLVNIQTYTHTESQHLTSWHEGSASWANKTNYKYDTMTCWYFSCMISGGLTFWISLSPSLSLSPKFGLSPKLSQKVSGFFSFGLSSNLALRKWLSELLSPKFGLSAKLIQTIRT